jgi:hypothetical protein
MIATCAASALPCRKRLSARTAELSATVPNFTYAPFQVSIALDACLENRNPSSGSVLSAGSEGALAGCHAHREEAVDDRLHSKRFSTGSYLEHVSMLTAACAALA